MTDRNQPPTKRSRTVRGHVTPVERPERDLITPVTRRHGRARERLRKREVRRTAQPDLRERAESWLDSLPLDRLPDLSKLRVPPTSRRWLIGAGIVLVVLLLGSVLPGGLRGTGQSATPTPVTTPTPGPTPTYDIAAWNGQQRFTMLIMGLDKRPGEEGTGFRTDTIILVSINPRAGQIGLLSLPRDVYVAVPNQPDLMPVNAIYIQGELARPGSGPRLLMDVIQYNLGIKVDSYAALSFDAVIKAVDAVGGIDIEVPVEIDDPEYPDMQFGFDPLFIPAGKIHMDGQLALKYARTRHQTNDFDRTRRQQQIILALRQQALRPEVLSGLIPQAPTLWNDLSKNVLTDLTFDQALGLGWYLKDLPLDSLKRGSLDGPYLQATTFGGQPILVVDRTRVAELLTQVFGVDYNRP